MNLIASCLQERYGKGADSDATDTMIVAATLNSGGNSGGFRTEPGEHLIAHTLTAPDTHAAPKDGKRQDGSRTDRIPIVTHTLQAEGADASEDGTGRGVPMVVRTDQTGANGIGLSDAAHSLQSTGNAEGLHYGSTVRRLTPTETERLQGFPDGWTCLCGVEPYSTMTCRCPDSARYRAMGNAVTVQVITWIGRRFPL